MGSVVPYETKSGRRYRVRYRKPDRSQTDRRGFKTKRDAELFLATVEVSKAAGMYVDPTRSRVSVEVWVRRWFASRSDLRDTSRERMAGIIDRFIVPDLGRYPLAELDHQTLAEWVSRLARTQGPASVRKIAGVLSGALRGAVSDKRLAVNPAAGWKLPKVAEAPKRYLTHEQVADLAAAVDALGSGQQNGAANGYGLLVRVLAYSGLRWGELAGLRVQDVDLRRRRLEISHTIVEVGGMQQSGTPKDYQVRSVPMPASLMAEIAELIDGRSADDAVFMGARSARWLRNRVFRRGWFDAAATSIGVVGLTPHEMRHTAASLAIGAGASVKAVQRMLGHESAEVTLNVYADLFDTDLDAVADALEARIVTPVVGRTWARGALALVPPPAENTKSSA